MAKTKGRTWCFAFFVVGAVFIGTDTAAARCIVFRSSSKPLSSALRSYARAASLQIIFDENAVAGRVAPSIEAKACPDEIFSELLRGSGLVARRAGGDIYVVSAERTIHPVPENRPAGYADIVVTARKRDERAIDVPIALTVMTGVQLEKRGARNLAEVLQESPGVGAYDLGNGMTKVTIRGVSTSLGANENGYYLDDLPFTGVTVPISPDVRAWDLERVEILRGPQGTLFGEGSMGGTIRVLTKGANLDEWEGNGSAYLSNSRGGGGNGGLKATLNVPIAPGILALRLVGTHEHYDGWIDDDVGGARNVNDQRFDSFRMKTRFDPNERLSFTGSYWYYKAHSPRGGTTATDAGQTPQSLRLGTSLEYRLYGLTGRYDLGGAELFYSYSRNRFALPQVGQYLTSRLVSGIRIGVDAQELRLASTAGGPLQWTVGGYLRNARRRDRFDFPLFGIDNIDRTRSRARAGFGEATYSLPGVPVDLTLGLRYYREALGGLEENSGVVTPDVGHHYESLNPRASIAWHPQRNATLYVSAAKGFRAGQLQPTYSIALASQLSIPLRNALRQDSIWTYEAGGKADLFDRRLTLEGAIYHSDWKDVTVRIPLGATGFNGLINSRGTRTTGVELSMVLRPTSGLMLTASGSYIDAVYAGTVPGTGVVEGAVVDEVARFTANAAVDYRTKFADGVIGTARIGWQHSSPRRYTAFGDFLPGDRIDRVDARIGVDFDRFSIALFADNLTDDNGAISSRTVQPVGLIEDIYAYRLRPRTIGVEASFHISGRP